MLVPLLRTDQMPTKEKIADWTGRLVDDCRNLVSSVLPLTTNETEFIERLNDKGEIVPELITDDAIIQSIIREHPGLRWKSLNVKKHFGLSEIG